MSSRTPVAPLLPALALCHAISGAAQEAKPAEISAIEGDAIVLPLELEDRFSFVVVTLNGKEVRLKFDLGNSSALALQQHVLESIGAVRGDESSTFQGIGGRFESQRHTVASVKIGPREFTDVEAWTDPPRAGYQPDERSGGFLGTGLLKSYVIVIDYPHRTLSLTPGSGASAQQVCKGVAAPFSTNPKWRGEAVTEARTDVGQLTLWWDTGAPLSVLRSTVVKEPHSAVAGSVLPTKQFQLGDGEFGPWRFDIWDMDLPGFDGFIGYDFFEKHVVCIDYPRSRVVIPRQ